MAKKVYNIITETKKRFDAMSIYGVGFNSKGKHDAYKNGSATQANIVWTSMLRRCYSESFQKSRPTYTECKVCDEWHDFQNFAEWFESHEYRKSGYQLDKDLIKSGNKVYSPDTCCLIPIELNLLLTNRSRYQGSLPRGVTRKRSTGKYVAQLNVDGTRVHLGYFETIDKAQDVYIAAKERYVKNKALEWANRIEWKAFVALMSWSATSNCKI